MLFLVEKNKFNPINISNNRIPIVIGNAILFTILKGVKISRTTRVINIIACIIICLKGSVGDSLPVSNSFIEIGVNMSASKINIVKKNNALEIKLNLLVFNIVDKSTIKLRNNTEPPMLRI